MLERVHTLATAIAQAQSPGGAFPSRVQLPGGAVEDRNCFVTALALRELSALERATVLPDELVPVRRRACGFLLRAEHPLRRRAFAFYPPRKQPFWLGADLPADADDTCVAALELVRAGLWSDADVEVIVSQHLVPFRATPAHVTEPFHRPGAFLTWFSAPHAPNDIDLVVNVNVLALLAHLGRRSAPGYSDSVALVQDGIRWFEDHSAEFARLAPYYASSTELLLALRHAVEAGALELDGALRSVESLERAGCLTRAGPLFCNRSGEIVWSSPALEMTRALKRVIVGGHPCPV